MKHGMIISAVLLDTALDGEPLHEAVRSLSTEDLTAFLQHVARSRARRKISTQLAEVEALAIVEAAGRLVGLDYQAPLSGPVEETDNSDKGANSTSRQGGVSATGISPFPSPKAASQKMASESPVSAREPKTCSCCGAACAKAAQEARMAALACWVRRMKDPSVFYEECLKNEKGGFDHA